MMISQNNVNDIGYIIPYLVMGLIFNGLILYHCRSNIVNEYKWEFVIISIAVIVLWPLFLIWGLCLAWKT